MRTLDEVTRELADVQDRLLELGDGDFSERYNLQKLQDELRAEAAQLREGADDGRSDEELVRELKARRAQLEDLERQQINMTSQSISGAQHISFAAGDRKLADDLTGALGIPDVHARIGRLKSLLDERGVEYPAE